MSEDEESFVQWHSSGTLNQGPWKFAHIFRAISPNQLFHVSLSTSTSPLGSSRVSTAPTIILPIEYPRPLWNIQEICQTPVPLNAGDQLHEISKPPVVVMSEPFLLDGHTKGLFSEPGPGHETPEDSRARGGKVESDHVSKCEGRPSQANEIAFAARTLPREASMPAPLSECPSQQLAAANMTEKINTVEHRVPKSPPTKTKVLPETASNTVCSTTFQRQHQNSPEESYSVSPRQTEVSQASSTLLASVKSSSLSPLNEIGNFGLYMATSSGTVMESTYSSQTMLSTEFAWTFSGDRVTEHVKKINHGAFSEVHLVCNAV